MPKFRYTALDAEGKKFRGELVARDEIALKDSLKAEDKFLLSATELEGKKIAGKLNQLALSDFCRQIGILLGAGVSLVRALTIIIDDENLKPNHRAIYKDILSQIKKGVSFSDALAEQGAAFPSLMINMFRSAEDSGNLDVTAKRMAEYFDKEYKLNRKIQGAMIYPAILLVMMVAIIIFISVYILPQFSELFAAMGELPLITHIVMGFSDILLSYWYIILIVVILGILGIRILLSVEQVRKNFDMLKLRLPIVGKLLRTIYTARFARTLNSLYGSGVAILSAIPTAINTVGNKYIESQLPKVVAMLRQGEPLNEALATIDGFENKLAASTRVGEEAGNLDEMLESIADSYDFSSEQSLSRMVALLEPIMLILMGILICVVMLAVLLPIFGSYNAIEQSAYL